MKLENCFTGTRVAVYDNAERHVGTIESIYLFNVKVVIESKKRLFYIPYSPQQLRKLVKKKRTIPPGTSIQLQSSVIFASGNSGEGKPKIGSDKKFHYNPVTRDGCCHDADCPYPIKPKTVTITRDDLAKAWFEHLRVPPDDTSIFDLMAKDLGL